MWQNGGNEWMKIGSSCRLKQKEKERSNESPPLGLIHASIIIIFGLVYYCQEKVISLQIYGEILEGDISILLFFFNMEVSWVWPKCYPNMAKIFIYLYDIVMGEWIDAAKLAIVVFNHILLKSLG